jgi:hypothetical protein
MAVLTPSRFMAVLFPLFAVQAWGASGDTGIKREPGQEWVVNFDRGRAVQIAFSGPERFVASVTGFVSEVKQDARGRYFELPRSALPQRIYFRFDRDNLVLDIPEGPVRTLIRERETAGSHVAWVIGALTLAGLTLIATVFLRRSRARRAGATPPGDPQAFRPNGFPPSA